MIHKWSIEHPYIIITFYAAVLILAVLAVAFYLPRRFMPYVESPMIGVVTMMPGLSAQEMETYVSKPIEEQLVNVKNLHYIRSTSQEGYSIVSLEFNYGTDMKKALFDVQSLMSIIQASLPSTGANMKPSWVLPIDPLNLPVLSISVCGDDRWSEIRLREFVDNEMVNRLKSVNDVYSVVPFGGFKRQLKVIADRGMLEACKLSILDIRNAIDRYNADRSGGALTSKTSESVVRFPSRALDPRDVMNYPVASSSDKSASSPSGGMGNMSSPSAIPITPTDRKTPLHTVRIKDVAKVTDGYWERRSAYNFVRYGKIDESIEASVIQDPAASSAKVVPAVMKVLGELQAENKGLYFEIGYDNSRFVNILFKNMVEELLLAIVLAGLAILLFLGEWRGTLISLITIPVSLAMAILCLIPLGMTLNSGTLIGFLLCIGRLVDDSIIDIHAVERHMRMGKDPKTATIDGIAEVRLAVIASTIVLVLALTPLLFCKGIVELMFRELVWPLILGQLTSMLVSFTLTALLSANLLKPHEQLVKERSTWFHRIFLGWFQRRLDTMEVGYGNVIRWMLKHRFWNMSRILVTVILGFAIYYFIGSEMMPLADVGQAYGVLEMDPGLSFTETEKATRDVEKLLGKCPEVEVVSTEIGTESMFESFSPYSTGYAMPQVNAATFMITLSDKDERKRDIWQVIDGVQKRALETIPGIRRFQIKEMGSDVMASSLAPISVLVYGKDEKELSDISEKVVDIAKNTPGVYQVATSWGLDKPSYRVDVYPDRAQAAGLSPAEISEQVYYALHGGLTNEFYRLPNIRQDTISIRYNSRDRKTLSDLKHLWIAAPDGRQIPLVNLAEISYEQLPTVIEHDGLRRVISVNGYYRKNGPSSMDVTMDIMAKAMNQINFPPGYGIEARGDMTQMMDSFARLLFGLELAVLFIFLVLVAQFKGVLQPLQMVFSLPLELSGAFLALAIAHQAFSTVSIMGIIVLTGMDVTTAILLIDIIARYRDKGIPRDQAVAEACPQRLRPILMTSIITMIVMLPVALSPRTGMDAYQPLGTVILGGLFVGTILSLFDIPIMHTYIDDLSVWINRKFLHREITWPVTDTTDV